MSVEWKEAPRPEPPVHASENQAFDWSNPIAIIAEAGERLGLVGVIVAVVSVSILAVLIIYGREAAESGPKRRRRPTDDDDSGWSYSTSDGDGGD